MDQHASDVLRRERNLIKFPSLVRAASVLLAVLVYPFSLAQKPAVPAETIVLHGRIYTVDAKHPWAEAIAIRGEKILAVGTDSEILHYQGAATKVIDAHGRLVLPGFTDCHAHFLDGSFTLQQLNL